MGLISSPSPRASTAAPGYKVNMSWLWHRPNSSVQGEDNLHVSSATETLSPELQLVYRTEQLINFRSIFRLLATRSSYKLTAHDLAPEETRIYLNHIGQYALLACGFVKPDFVWSHLNQLQQPGYPLDRRIYDALPSATLVTSVLGKVAECNASIVLREVDESTQLVLGFTGTYTFGQTWRDLDARQVRYKNSKRAFENATVHSGFWAMYQGLRDEVFQALREAMQHHPGTKDLVVTGHSMGAALSYLLCLDLLRDVELGVESAPPISKGTRISIVCFGAPRLGNETLVKYWNELVLAHRDANGGGQALRLYSVRAYNDGVPSLPPYSWGYRHMHVAETTYYLYHGTLYVVPASEAEHSMFDIDETSVMKPEVGSSVALHYPRGGHNYYGRDSEKYYREMGWIGFKTEVLKSGWEERYLQKRKMWEEKWKRN